MTPTPNSQPPLVISEEARALSIELYQPITAHGLQHCEKYAEKIQKLINQATEKLTKENEELKNSLLEAQHGKYGSVHYATENQTLTTRIKELEAEVERLKGK